MNYSNNFCINYPFQSIETCYFVINSSSISLCLSILDKRFYERNVLNIHIYYETVLELDVKYTFNEHFWYMTTSNFLPGILISMNKYAYIHFYANYQHMQHPHKKLSQPCHLITFSLHSFIQTASATRLFWITPLNLKLNEILKRSLALETITAIANFPAFKMSLHISKTPY